MVLCRTLLKSFRCSLIFRKINLAKFFLVVNALLSGQWNLSDKKIVRTKNCLDQKIIRTKKLSGQLNFSALSMPLFFVFFYFLSIRLLICCLDLFCPYLCPIVQQKQGTYFRIIVTLLMNIMGLNNYNLSPKTLKGGGGVMNFETFTINRLQIGSDKILIKKNSV